MRLLGVVRLSDLTDETTSPERQREKITGWASLHGHSLAGVAEDLDVSGAVSPFKRADLGPWLNDRADEWDGLIVARLDRLTRSLFDFLDLWRWLDSHGKALVCLDPSLDMTTPAGRAFAQTIAVFAEFERETIRARVLDAYSKIRRSGNYAGGAVPFGYVPVKNPGKGWHLEHDPVYAPVVTEMARRYLAGESLNSIAVWLNDTDVPTSRNVQRARKGRPPAPSDWRSTTVRKVLGSPAVMGVIPAGEDVLRDSDGVAVQRAEAIVNRSDFEQIGRMLEANAGKAGPRMNASPLLHVAHCGRCGSVLYTSQVRSVLRSGAKVYMYYQCGGARQSSGCGERKVRAELLEELTESAVLGALADVPRRVKVVTPAEDHSAELASVTEAIINLEGDRYDRGLFPGEDGAARYAEIMTRLQARQAALRALPSRDEKVEWPETGETFGQYWDALTEPERHQYLRSSGVRVSVLRADAGLDQEVTLNLSGRIEEADLDRPWEDVVRNRSVMIFRHGLRVDVDLGDLAVLRERAALAS